MPVQIQLRRGTASEWTSNSTVVLAAGEVGVETDQARYKIGNGTTQWSALPYASLPASAYAPSTFASKGQLIVGTGVGTSGLLNLGTNDQVLVAQSGQTTGLQWQSTLANLTLTAPTITGTASAANATLSGTLNVTGNTTLGATSVTTLTPTTVTGGTFNDSLLTRPKEPWQVNATALSGTVAINVATGLNWLYTGATNANFTLNFTNVNAALADNQSLTVGVVVTNGTGGYPTAVQVAGTPVTVNWQGNAAPTAGNASKIDAYVFTFIKTAANVYTVLGSQTKFGT